MSHSSAVIWPDRLTLPKTGQRRERANFDERSPVTATDLQSVIRPTPWHLPMRVPNIPRSGDALMQYRDGCRPGRTAPEASVVSAEGNLTSP